MRDIYAHFKARFRGASVNSPSSKPHPLRLSCGKETKGIYFAANSCIGLKRPL